MSDQKKVFRISDLPQMQSSDISHNDLIMVSDTLDANTSSPYVSKKLSIGTLKTALTDEISKSVSKSIAPEVTETVQANVEQKLDTTIEAKVDNSIFSILSALNCGGADE
jgi:hypothetical protein